MTSPLVVEAFREQLQRVLDWHAGRAPRFGWGMVLHRRSERGNLWFGVVTLGGESFLLTDELLDDLAAHTMWLDGVVPVRMERAESPDELLAVVPRRPDRGSPVASLSIGFDGGITTGDMEAFAGMAGELDAASCPAELFVLAEGRPRGWPL